MRPDARGTRLGGHARGLEARHGEVAERDLLVWAEGAACVGVGGEVGGQVVGDLGLRGSSREGEVEPGYTEDDNDDEGKAYPHALLVGCDEGGDFVFAGFAGSPQFARILA